MKRLTISVIVCIVLFALAGCNLLPVTGSVSGTVRDTANNPISQVTVTVANRSSLTNSAGYYSLAGLAQGNYILTATKAGYQEYSQNVSITPASTQTIEIIMESEQTGNLSGVVTISGTQTPLAGVTVALNNVLTVSTDSQGVYHFTNIPPNTYTLTATKTGYDSHTVSVTIHGGQNNQYNFALVEETVVPGGHVTGIVKDAISALPLSNVIVSAGGKSMETTANGEYLLENLPAGATQITGIKDNYLIYSGTVTVISEATVTKNFSLQPAVESGIISGYVTDGRGGPAVSGASVSYAGVSSTTDQMGYFSMQIPANTEDDVIITKIGRATSKIQEVSLLSGGSAYFEVPNRVAFNPNESLDPPTILVNGFEPNATVSGTINMTVQILGENAASVFYVYVGGEQRFPVADMGVEIDADSVTVNTTKYPNGLSYLKILAYDANENATVLFLPFIIQNQPNVNTKPAGVSNLTAQSVSYGQNLGYYTQSRAEFYSKYHLTGDPGILQLPSGRDLQLASFTMDGTICNQLFWKAVTGATGYSVYRSFDNLDYVKIGDVQELIQTNEYGLSGYYDDYSAMLAPNKKTYYRVVPYNSYGAAESTVTIDVTPLPPLNVMLLAPANKATNVSLNPTFTWSAQSNGLGFPGQTLFSYGFWLFDATENLIWQAVVESSSQYTPGKTLMPNSVYSWDIYDGAAEVVYRNDAACYSAAVSIIGSGVGSLNGEYIFTTTLGQ